MRCCHEDTEPSPPFVGRMKRSVSVKNVTQQTASSAFEMETVPHDTSDDKISHLREGCVESLREVDCGSCSVSFEPAGLHCSLSALSIKAMGKRTLGNLAQALECVLELDSFVLTFDFRECDPHQDLAKAVSSFSGAVGSAWDQRLKSMVILVKGSIFTVAMKGVVGAFIKDYTPKCPYLICHQAHIADEFFRETLQLEATSFVSLCGVTELPSQSWRTVFVGECCATLAPQGSRIPGAVTAPATLHALPNGDTRVIQSPAGDILMKPRDVRSLLAEDAACSLASFKSGGSLSGDARTVANLKFQCPPSSLRLLLGAHLHIGELVYDSEVESRTKHCAFYPVVYIAQVMLRCYVGLLSFSRSDSEADTRTPYTPSRSRSTLRSQSGATARSNA